MKGIDVLKGLDARGLHLSEMKIFNQRYRVYIKLLCPVILVNVLLVFWLLTQFNNTYMCCAFRCRNRIFQECKFKKEKPKYTCNSLITTYINICI